MNQFSDDHMLFTFITCTHVNLKLNNKYAENFINQINLWNSNSTQLYIKYLKSFSL